MGCFRNELRAIIFCGLIVMAGCHSSPGTSKTAEVPGASTPSPSRSATSPSVLPGQLGGANSFVPYADKPPLGTPVETH